MKSSCKLGLVAGLVALFCFPVGLWAQTCANPQKLGANFQISTSPSGGALVPVLQWAGSEYGLAWYDRRHGATTPEIYFTRATLTGTPLTPDQRITFDPANSVMPSLAWTGTEYGLAWHDTRDGGDYDIFFRRLKADGSLVGGELQLTANTSASTNPSLVWSGTEYGLGWRDNATGNSEIYFARISAAGVQQGTNVQITNATGESLNPSLAWRTPSMGWLGKITGPGRSTRSFSPGFPPWE